VANTGTVIWDHVMIVSGKVSKTGSWTKKMPHRKVRNGVASVNTQWASTMAHSSYHRTDGGSR